ncbi:nitroreductase family protein [bacterium]|nr:nitroreductase family protein [bacterium]
MSKNIHIITLYTVCSALILGFLFFYFVQLPKIKQASVFDNMLTRMSTRHYIEGKKLTEKQFELLFKAAMSAPTARNTQPWEFIRVENKDTLNKIADSISSSQMLRTASGAIVVLGNLDKTPNMTEFWSQDTSAATQNILLEAHNLGLGAVWIGVYPIEERVKSIREIFNLPDNVIPLCVISIGYPTGEDVAKDKWKIENIHKEIY